MSDWHDAITIRDLENKNELLRQSNLNLRKKLEGAEKTIDELHERISHMQDQLNET